MYEILTPKEMSEADRRTIAAGTAGIDLMERAGAAVARVATEVIKDGRRIAVFCGPGNNGGDGFVAARILHEQGFVVDLFLLGERDQLKGDAAIAASRWTGGCKEFYPQVYPPNPQYDLFIDALFGAGLSRDLSGAAEEIVKFMLRRPTPVLSVDLPSGIDGMSGRIRGISVFAEHTVTFCRMKPGHLLMPGRVRCGKITVADIGIPDRVVKEVANDLWLNTPELWIKDFPWPKIYGHKYHRGHAVVLSGPAHATGAARLAARAALRAGAGLVTVAAPKAAVPVLSAALEAVMVREANGAAGLKKLLGDERLNAVLLGPGNGVGKATRAAVEAVVAGHVMKRPRRLVLDADAISSFTGESGKLANLMKKSWIHGVCTPHSGEFAKLFSNDSAQILQIESKVEMVRAAAELLNMVVVLKGADTVISSGGRAVISNNAPPWLATAGSGDVLSGIVLGLLAQQMPVLHAACAAVWLHGEAAKEAGFGMTAEDLEPALKAVLKRLYEDFGPES